MVVFDELRITEDGQYLIINARIRKDILKQYPNAYIKSIHVCDSSNYDEGIPSKAISIYEYNDNSTRKTSFFDAIHFTAISEKLLNNKLIFVYIEVAHADSPCGCASNPAVGVAMDMSNVYSQFMSYINELCDTDSCDKTTPSGLTDFILRFNALLLAMDSKHYAKGVEFFDKWFSKDSKTKSTDCGCHG